MRRHEPDLYARIAHIVLPKDYVRYRCTGEFATDVADASGTSLFDVRRRTWSNEMCDALEIPREWLSSVNESPVACGSLDREPAQRAGLRPGTPVVAGAGDQAAGAVGAGVVAPGIVSVALGTSGVVFAPLDTVQVDPLGRTHTFCHAVPWRWHVMGVMLSAGGSLRWVRDQITDPALTPEEGDPYDRITAQASAVPAGSEGLLYLPYLTGERTPHADPFARGAFVGLTLRHTRGHLVRAVMEGVAMGLRDSLEILLSLGVTVREVRVTGGGGRSAQWRQILADVLNVELTTVAVAEGAAYGAALLAAVGVGAFPSVEAACGEAVATGERTTPDAANRDVYDGLYRLYGQAYLVLKDVMHSLARA
jgi:xylulokinase